MIKNKKITLIIPCKNEENVIERTLKAVPGYIDEILVVDNGSTDNTAEVARNAGAKVLIENRKLGGIGYGYAHMTGLKHATGDYIFAMDGDDTYPSYEIKNIVEQMEEKSLDFVSCHRLPLKNNKAISKTRRLGIYALNLEVLFLYGKWVNDVLTGMWGVRKEVVPLLELRMGDWNLSPEIKISAMNHEEVNFAEYHIDHFVREHEPSKQMIWKTGVNHLLYILKRRFTQDNRLYGFVSGTSPIGYLRKIKKRLAF